ncbi:16536_t:CDS:2, partial [Funneliformis mosseae]
VSALTEEVHSLKKSQLRNELSTSHKSSALASKDQIQRDASLTLELETNIRLYLMIWIKINTSYSYEIWFDKSKPPEEAPNWLISQSYHSDDNND